MDPQKLSNYQSSYDRIAEEYTVRIAGELKDKPLDRMLLEGFAARVNGTGRVCDLGCGPGHVARYLHDRGVDIFGVDLSPGMLEQARKLNSNIEFQQGNMLALDVEDGAWAGIIAFYSIVHIPRAEVPQAFREMQRVLKPGGFLFLAFHLGDEVLHEEDCWGHQVSLDLVLFRRKEVERYLMEAGFAVEDSLERDPYPPEVEYQSRRAYILARKLTPQ
ncbi:MAG: class I SAM-dependent methyltransferase [Acidobacteria bacterium]|nr:MAG: methylase [Acidobacteria bacterium 13_1_40CM_4_58_4]PYT59532.1 MAG: class I SAM-dependent methyltransferase [Acidobacteriota bacterium]